MKEFFFPCSIGVRCQTSKRYALAVIDERGAKRLRSGRTKNKIILWNFPIFRGISYFFASIIALLCAFWDSTKLSSQPLPSTGVSEKIAGKLNIKKESVIISILLLVSLVIALIIFGYVPTKLSFVFIGMSMNFALRNFLIALVKVALFYLILLILRFIPAMQDLYKFNGACNQVRLRQGSTIKSGKADYHTPFNVLNIIIFTFLLSMFVITCVGISIAAHWNFLINLALFLLCAGVAFEICLLFEKLPALRMIALVTDFFVSAKPSTTHDEIARVALNEARLSTGEKQLNDDKISLSALLAEMQTELEKAGKYEKSDVEWIIATVLGVSRAEAKLTKFFTPKQAQEILKATAMRAAGKPLSAIFGFVEFYGLRFDVNKKVLAPRMETEILVEEALKQINNIKNAEVLDLGTGSGAIAVSIAKFSNAKVCAIDVSKQALQTAKSNAEKNGVKVEFFESDMFSKLKNRKKFDVIVSNPPYIRTLDIAGLDEEVRSYDPALALDGGEDGLKFYRIIASQAPQHLKKGGWLFLEIGQGQFKDVEKLLQEAGFVDISSKKDYAKIVRVIRAKYDKRK